MTDIHSRKYPLDNMWVALAKDMGISFQDVLRHAHLPLDLPNRKQPMLSGDEYLRLWDAVAHLLRDEPAYPLRLAQTMTAETFSPPIFACLCSVDLNMALERIAKYKPLVGPIRITMKQTDQQTTVCFSSVTERESLPPTLIAFELVFWVNVARMATRERIVPESVHVAIDLPAIEVYEAYFGVGVQRDQFSGITFMAADARKPFLTMNTGMWSIFEPELRKRMDDLTKESSFRERVRACLMEMLASGQYSKAAVASRLAVSGRTLQRRLQDEGTNFRAVLDELREELALHYLQNSDYSTAEIAFLLGYEEPNSFFRAFRGWTGKTPDVARTAGNML